MAALIRKKSGGKSYLYLVESKRVNGKPRITWQKYIGSADRLKSLLEQGGGTPSELDVTSFGPAALGTTLWNILLVMMGITLRRNWNVALPYFEYFTYIAAAIIVILVILWFRSVLKRWIVKHTARLSTVSDDH